MINEDHLNMEIRKFLKKMGIASQKNLEKSILNSYNAGKLKLGSNLNIEMKMTINKLKVENIISDKIKIK